MLRVKTNLKLNLVAPDPELEGQWVSLIDQDDQHSDEVHYVKMEATFSELGMSMFPPMSKL